MNRKYTVNMKNIIRVLILICFLASTGYSQQITKRQQYLVANTLNQFSTALEKYASGDAASRFILEEIFESPDNQVWNDIDNMTMVSMKEYLNLIQLSKNSLSISFMGEPNINDSYYFLREVERYGEKRKILHLVCKLSKSINNSTNSLYYIVNVGNYKLVNCYKEIPSNIQLASTNNIKTEDDIVSNILSKYSDLLDSKTQTQIGNDLYDASQYKVAVKWYRKAAEQGNNTAQFNLGYMYDEGVGVSKNDVEAVKWYRKAAEQGDSWSQYYIGTLYHTGDGVDQDFEEAIKWFQKSAEQGDKFGQYSLGRVYEWGNGTDQDYKEAAKWYQKAAEQGDMDAQFSLANLYDDGYGVEEDDKEAVKWFRKAAEQGNATAQFNLGETYRFGKGIEKNIELAKYWYKKACENGDADACEQYKLIK